MVASPPAGPDAPAQQALLPGRAHAARPFAGSSRGIDDAQGEALAGLIARIAGRDEAALAALYDALLARVHGLVRRIVHDERTAEEVTEDVFFQVWRQAERYDGARGHPIGWVLSIARTRALDSLRRADPAFSHPDPHVLNSGDATSNTAPLDFLHAAQEASHLHAVLDSLEPLPRQLLALAFFRGLTHEEIARSCDLPLGTVKSHIRRALVSLREALAPRMSRSAQSS